VDTQAVLHSDAPIERSVKAGDDVPLTVAMAAVVYLLATVVILFVVRTAQNKPDMGLEPADVIAMVSGTVAAMALTAIYLQSRQVRSETEKRRTDAIASEPHQRHAAALRAADLQAAYYSPEMISARVHADLCLLDLSGDSNAVLEMVRWWVDGSFGKLPDVVRAAGASYGLDAIRVSEALTMMVGFYTRVQHHLETHDDVLQDPKQQLAVMDFLGWRSWRTHGLVNFARACDDYQGKNVGTFFVDRMLDLDKRYLNAGGERTQMRSIDLPRDQSIRATMAAEKNVAP
jgi:hypothetical protein